MRQLVTIFSVMIAVVLINTGMILIDPWGEEKTIREALIGTPKDWVIGFIGAVIILLLVYGAQMLISAAKERARKLRVEGEQHE